MTGEHDFIKERNDNSQGGQNSGDQKRGNSRDRKGRNSGDLRGRDSSDPRGRNSGDLRGRNAEDLREKLRRRLDSSKHDIDRSQDVRDRLRWRDRGHVRALPTHTYSQVCTHTYYYIFYR